MVNDGTLIGIRNRLCGLKVRCSNQLNYEGKLFGAFGLNRTDYPRVTNPVHRQQCFKSLFMVGVARFERATSEFLAQPSDLTDNTPR